MQDFIPAYPFNFDEDPAWANHINKIGDAINNISTTGGSGVEVQDANTGRVTINGNLSRYLYRYIHIRVTSDEEGETLVNPATFAGSVIYLQVNNNSSSDTPGTAFQSQAFEWSALHNLYYRVSGLGAILFGVQTTAVAQPFVEVTHNVLTIDTTNVSAIGAPGIDGSAVGSVSIFRRADSTPTTPTGGSINIDTGVVTGIPGGWSRDIPDGDDDLFISIAEVFGIGDLPLVWSDPVLYGRIGQDALSPLLNYTYVAQNNEVLNDGDAFANFNTLILRNVDANGIELETSFAELQDGDPIELDGTRFVISTINRSGAIEGTTIFNLATPIETEIGPATGDLLVRLSIGLIGVAGPEGRSSRVDIAYGVGSVAETEVQEMVFEGTRSNVVADIVNETYKFHLPDSATSGTTDGGTPTYSFDLDVSNSVFSGVIDKTLATGLDATAILNDIALTAAEAYPQITSSDVEDVDPVDANVTFDLTAEDAFGDSVDGFLTFPFEITSDTTVATEGAIRLFLDFAGLELVYTAIGTYNSIEELATAIAASIDGDYSATADGTEITIVGPTNVNEVRVSGTVVQGGDSLLYSAILTDNVEGNAPNVLGAVKSGFVSSKAIEIYTNQSLDLQHIFSSVENQGTDIDFRLEVTNGDPADPDALSRYTVFDYSNNEISMFSGAVSSSTDSDLQTITATIAGIVNNNTETPIDFRATPVANGVIFLAQSDGAVNGLWRIAAFHGTGDGDLDPQTTTVATEGSDGGLISTYSFPSGRISDGSYAQAVAPDAIDFIAERYISFEADTEPSVSTDPADYDFRKFRGDQGIAGNDAILITITSDTGTIFRNAAGAAKTFTANVHSGGIEANANQYATYRYRWATNEGATLCVDSGGNVLSQNGQAVAAVNGVCPIGTPADTTQNTTHFLRSITIGPEDINQELRIGVEVTNI